MLCRTAAAERPAAQAPPHSIVPTKEHTLPSGDKLKVMAVDFGFRTGATRLYEEQYGEVPKSLFNLVCLLASMPHCHASRYHTWT